MFGIEVLSTAIYTSESENMWREEEACCVSDHHIHSYLQRSVLCPGSFLRADLELSLLLTTGPISPSLMMLVSMCCFCSGCVVAFRKEKRSRETWPKFRNRLRERQRLLALSSSTGFITTLGFSEQPLC